MIDWEFELIKERRYYMSKRNWKCFFVGMILAWIIGGCVCAVYGDVPIKFTVETSRADVQEIPCYHGETLQIEATFKNYGKDLVFDPEKEASIFWQTNGMSAYYWRTNNVTVISNTMTAVFLPEMDPGANTVFGFIGIPGDIYRASFVLRMKNSPGVKTQEMEWPYKELDFSQIEVKNAPYFEKWEVIEEIEERDRELKRELEIEIEEARPPNWETVSNRAMTALQTETDPTVPCWAKNVTPPVETDPTVPNWAKNPTPPVTTEVDPTVPSWAKGLTPPIFSESDPTVPSWAKQLNPPTITETDPTVPNWAKNPTPPDEKFLSIHGGLMTTTNSKEGVKIELQGGKGIKNVSDGADGALLEIRGGADFFSGDRKDLKGGRGGRLIIYGGGWGRAKSGDGAQLIIGGAASRGDIIGKPAELRISRIQGGDELIITHTATNNETLTERIIRDTADHYQTKGDYVDEDGVKDIVTKEYIQEKLEVYLYVGEDGGIYVHTN